MTLTASKLGKSFGTKNILSSISFEIRQDQSSLVILGENGVGKSLLLRLLSGSLAPDEGQVFLTTPEGVINPALNPLGRHFIGYQTEELGLWPSYTTTEALYFISQIKQSNPASVPELIKACHLEKIENEPVRFLSQGYKKRLGLAMAFIGESPFILLDEPTNGLDPIECRLFMDLIKEKRKKSCIIMASHRLEEALDLGGQVIILQNQHLVYHQTINEDLKEIYYQYHQ